MTEPTPELRADFLEWLRTGSFRGVRPGMTRGECVRRLGEPEEWGGYGKSKRRAGIYYWSLLEFHFATQKAPADADNDELYLIFNDRQETNAALFGSGYDEGKAICLPEVEDLIQQAGVGYSRCMVTHEYALEEGWSVALLLDNLLSFYFRGKEGKEVLVVVQQSKSRGEYFKLKEIS